MDNQTIILIGVWAFAIATSLKREITGAFMFIAYVSAILVSLAITSH